MWGYLLNMKNYNLQERIDMLLTIGECEENCLLASRVYAQKYPQRKHPDKRVLERLLRDFRRTGNVAYEKANRRKTIVGNEENELRILGAIIENPHVSQRQISRDTDISTRSIGRVLQKYKFHPYHIQLHQTLSNADFDRRLDFCMWVMDKLGQDEHFLDFVMFSDESTFHNNGLVNRHNFHYYSDENPHLLRTLDHQHRWSVNVWGGILGSKVIGPHFFDGTLNGEKFRRFLRDDLPELLEDVDLDIRRRMWMQLDGAPAHYHGNVRDGLNRRFPNRWIGRGGPHNWPARSPDLTCVDFFLWGYIKNSVYDVPPTTPDDMKQRIRNAFQTITPQTLRKVKLSFEKRILSCIDENGHHFEHLLK